jgi:hypothetical protein
MNPPTARPAKSCPRSSGETKMTRKAYNYNDELIGTTEFDIRELDALKPEDWLRLIDKADPLAKYEVFKRPDGTFQIVDTANVSVQEVA